MPDLPGGTVTFLFTDVEGSTPRWEKGRAAMMTVVARQEAIIRSAVAAQGGCLFKTVGDACYAAFGQAHDALAAAVSAQRALAADDGLTDVRVRIALHTGAAEQRDGDYFGLPLNRVARVLAAGHGGQVLLSHATEQLVRDILPPGIALVDLGEHRLKDLLRAERIYQATADGLPPAFPPLRTLTSRPNNLPLQSTSFVGRRRELAAVKARLAASRLLTLTGIGGAGKTRLALQAAAEVLDAFPDGVWFADLAPVVDPGLVASTVAAAAGIREQPGRPAAATLVDHVRRQRVLLVLDNCEHVVDAAAAVAADVLRAAPHAVMLATSREPLAVGGETVWPVPPLDVPPAPRPGAEAADPRIVARRAAVRLFVDRAAAVRPDFALTPVNAAAVADICRRLDGIPLAIELAAARVAHLPPEQILARLHPRFDRPGAGRRTSARRQRTLAAALDWSHDLLDPREAALFRRLSVFRGGWTLEAMDAVCAGDPLGDDDLLDVLARLVDKSLVVYVDADETGRYRFLETVRAYARARCIAAGEHTAVRARHGRYFVALAEVAASRLAGPEQDAWVARLDAERDNLRAALDRADRDGDAASGQRLCAALWRHWLHRSHVAEGLTRAERALREASAEPTPARAMALFGLGAMLSSTGDEQAAIPWLRQGIEAYRKLEADRTAGGRGPASPPGSPEPGLDAAASHDLRDLAEVSALLDPAAERAPLAERSLWQAIERALRERGTAIAETLDAAADRVS